jgi:hypothetical protein
MIKALGERSIASSLRVALGIAWWLVVVCLTLLGGLLVVSLCVNLDSYNMTFDLPVELKPAVPVQASSASIETDAQIDRLSGNLRFPVRNGLFISTSLFMLVLLLGLLLWVVTQLREIFRSLSKGQVFIPENARRIRWVGFAVIVGEFAHAVMTFFWGYYASRHFTADGMSFVATADFNGLSIACGFAILVIAEVFREGTRLQEEQSLTI